MTCVSRSDGISLATGVKVLSRVTGGIVVDVSGVGFCENGDPRLPPKT